MSITRESTIKILTIANNEALTAEFDMTPFAGGLVIVPGTWTAANIGFKVSPTSGGTFVTLVDYLGSPVQVSGVATGTSKAYQMPDELFAAGFVKLWSKSTTIATETDTNQGGARTLTVVLKG